MFENRFEGMHDIECYWDGTLIRFSISSIREIDTLRLDIYDICAMLPDTFDCANSRRAIDTMERCITYKSQILKMVLVKDILRIENKLCLTVKHVKYAGRRYRRS